MRILITEFMDDTAVDGLRAAHEVAYDPGLVDDATRLLDEAPTCDALIVRNRTQVRGELLAALGRCKVVGRLGVGLDNIDVEGCAARGIQVIPATGANAHSVAEYVVATAMLLLRGAYGSTESVAAGQWPRHALSQGRELAGKTLGLVGFGSIGQQTARLARALGMRVAAFTRAGGEEALRAAGVPARSLDDLLAEADVVSLHVPLTDATRQLLDARRIAGMKKGAILINTARGGIVDEQALVSALRSGQLAGAALDVFAEEPLVRADQFRGCPNLLLTPHIAGLSVEANERVSSLVASKVLEALR
ncbi:hydroxyacid dehydrogenase [Ramlibacter sp. AW1]|uniref:Hydroxyacid dehydrogenase n=1 Tax=Ramlibacter aurantiacus TaxID=2801330 RepID=A0A936ZW10_9BURK|nr:hydroxyacid dehydrogenase [Ramlibacter aurantiacus]MBL0421589.1 hydroxyacid dehydrogenase [Ramlibacter aurantiacus]